MASSTLLCGTALFQNIVTFAVINNRQKNHFFSGHSDAWYGCTGLCLQCCTIGVCLRMFLSSTSSCHWVYVWSRCCCCCWISCFYCVRPSLWFVLVSEVAGDHAITVPVPIFVFFLFQSPLVSRRSGGLRAGLVDFSLCFVSDFVLLLLWCLGTDSYRHVEET